MGWSAVSGTGLECAVSTALLDGAERLSLECGGSTPLLDGAERLPAEGICGAGLFLTGLQDGLDLECAGFEVRRLDAALVGCGAGAAAPPCFKAQSLLRQGSGGQASLRTPDFASNSSYTLTWSILKLLTVLTKALPPSRANQAAEHHS